MLIIIGILKICLFDVEDYQNNSRAFKVNPEDLGFYIAHNQEELNQIIENTTDDQFREKDEAVMQFYGVTETGKASELICKAIDEHYRKNKTSNNYK